MSTYARYMDKYKNKNRSFSSDVRDPKEQDKKPVMTDRNAYLSFLEVQLERVTSACMTVQGFAERMEQLQTQIVHSDEKVVNITRLVKLLQSYSEGQEEEQKAQKTTVSELNRKMELILERLERVEGDRVRFVENNDKRDRQLDAESRLLAVEEKLNSLKLRSDNDSSKRTDAIDLYMKDNDRNMKDLEKRFITKLSKNTEENETLILNIQKQIETVVERQGRDFASEFTALERKVEDVIEKSNKLSKRGLESSMVGKNKISISETPLANTKKLEEALNQWLEKLEDQVNIIEDKIEDKANRTDVEKVNKRLDAEINKRQAGYTDLYEITTNIEKLQGKAANENSKRYAEIENRVFDIEERFTHTMDKKVDMIRSIEDRMQEDIYQTKQLAKQAISRAEETESHSAPRKDFHSEDLFRLEDKLNRKVAQAVDGMSDLVRKYAKGQKSLNNRVSVLETRLKGRSTSNKTTPASAKKLKETKSSPQIKKNDSREEKKPARIVSFNPSEQESIGSPFRNPPIRIEEEKENIFTHPESLDIQVQTKSPFKEARDELTHHSREEPSYYTRDDDIDPSTAEFIGSKNRQSQRNRRNDESISEDNRRPRDTQSLSDLKNRERLDYSNDTVEYLESLKYRGGKAESRETLKRDRSENSVDRLAAKKGRKKFRESLDIGDAKKRSRSVSFTKHSLRGESASAPTSSKNIKRDGFNFSPFSTQRSKINELSSKIRREREANEGKIKEIKELGKKMTKETPRFSKALAANINTRNIKATTSVQGPPSKPKKRHLRSTAGKEGTPSATKKKSGKESSAKGGKPSDRLARLERMYQELTDLENRRSVPKLV